MQKHDIYLPRKVFLCSACDEYFNEFNLDNNQIINELINSIDSLNTAIHAISVIYTYHFYKTLISNFVELDLVETLVIQYLQNINNFRKTLKRKLSKLLIMLLIS